MGGPMVVVTPRIVVEVLERFGLEEARPGRQPPGPPRSHANREPSSATSDASPRATTTGAAVAPAAAWPRLTLRPARPPPSPIPRAPNSSRLDSVEIVTVAMRR
ncbi:MAG: hypothetical protein M5U01_10190 [Ardenticatenaceae bacterium]|nr:hypothetical protein [Ardenticatenaceae bacterium]